MAKTSLIITSTAGTKKLQKTLTDINSAATNDQLKSFAQALNNLTTNTYGETNRVDRTNCDTEDSGGKQFREITITGATRGATATIACNITAGGTANPAVFFYSTGGSVQVLATTAGTSESTTVAVRTFTVPNNTGTIYAGLYSNDDFYADFVSVTVE